jgi:hypothetical protein
MCKLGFQALGFGFMLNDRHMMPRLSTSIREMPWGVPMRIAAAEIATREYAHPPQAVTNGVQQKIAAARRSKMIGGSLSWQPQTFCHVTRGEWRRVSVGKSCSNSLRQQPVGAVSEFVMAKPPVSIRLGARISLNE